MKPDQEAAAHVAALSSLEVEARWDAARALGGRADAVAALAQALDTEQVARVREAIMTALVRVGDEASVRALLPHLRSQDAGQRATAIEALQALPERVREVNFASPNRLSDQPGEATRGAAKPEKTDGAARCSWGLGL
jgi:HEAT repeat protein